MTSIEQFTRQLSNPQEDAFREILATENVYLVFQPIVDLKKQTILGYEALIRGPEDTVFYRPINLFETANRLGLGAELEIMCRTVSIREYATLSPGARLFLNVSPSALADPDFKKGATLKCLEEYEINPDQVVIEITEQQQTREYKLLAEALTHYRTMGFTVALDDLGAGYSGLRLWTELLPDFIKIDKYFIRNIDTDRIKMSFVASLLRMSAASNCQIIAEGVEQETELLALQKIGIGYAQGYYFARPEKMPVLTIAKEKFKQAVWNEAAIAAKAEISDLAKLARRIEPMPASMTVSQIVEYLQSMPNLQLLPILSDTTPVGIINRHQFFNKLMASRFGIELYGKRPISKLLEEKVLVVDINAELELASQQIISASIPEQAFLITSEGKYFGVATVLDLLEVMTEHKIQNARHANPLTLLPGIVPINIEANRMLAARHDFSVAYFDLDNFKPYNDYYGYDAGDRIIKLLAGLLQKIYSNSAALIGHIGGDDFIVMDPSVDYLDSINLLLNAFREQITAFYENCHLLEGGITGIDRSGQTVFFGLTSVSVGVVPPEGVASCQSHIDIADLASEAKRLAKTEPGNSYFINRRTIIRI